MKKIIRLFLYNLIYSVLVIPSFLYFLVSDSNDQFAAFFIAGLTIPWSLIVALIFGIFNLEMPNKLFDRGLLLLFFTLLNQIIIFLFSLTKQKNE